MEIKIEGKVSPRTIKELDWGEVFVLSEQPWLYMVIESDYGLGLEADCDYDEFAIRLNDGTIWGFKEDTPITRVTECVLTAKI